MGLKLVLASAELAGFAKTGGLAEVVGALGKALARRGHACIVLLPLYRSARFGPIPLTPTGHTFTAPVGGVEVSGALWRATLPNSQVPVYLIEHAEYFERDDPRHGRGFYNYTLPGGRKQDYPDNCPRFAFFCRAVLEALRLLEFWPDVLHLNDWQTGLVPVYLKEEYSGRPGYERVRTLLTIHNLASQGVFPHSDLPLTGLPWRLFNPEQLEFHGHLNFLKAGIVFADLLSTVSPTYAREIQTPYVGCGLDGVLARRKDRLTGIISGIDYDYWNPATDPHLAAPYDPATVAQSKPLCKAALQRRYGLPEQPRTPLLAMISRLVEQKGVQLVGAEALAILGQDTQFVILGEGDQRYQRMFQDLRARHPDRVGFLSAYDEGLAHQIEAGADIFLMPSAFEPCGLNQLYSLKYGTVPIVRATGGLADTVVDATPERLAAGQATGFSFIPYTAEAYLETVRRALELYRCRPEVWLGLMQAGMRQDWSFDRSAAEYERLYETALNC